MLLVLGGVLLVLNRVFCTLLGVLVDDGLLYLAGLAFVELVLADQGKVWYFVIVLLEF